MVIRAGMASPDPSVLERVAQATARIRTARDPDTAADALRAALEALPPGTPEAVKGELAGVAELVVDRLRIARTREQLLSSVAHDLRNPLNTFAMSAGLLREDVDRGDVDRGRATALLQRMDRAVERMQHLIEDLAEAGRVDSRRVDLVLRDAPAERIVRESLAAAESLAAERGAALEAGEIDASAAVSADRVRLVQAFAKLVGYALRVTGDGATVRVSAAGRGDHVAFTFMALPGSAARGATFASSAEGRGGLALLLARGLVELHGGSVTVEADDRLVVTAVLPRAR
jgi:two-component system sensor histidine kinase BaeS